MCKDQILGPKNWQNVTFGPIHLQRPTDLRVLSRKSSNFVHIKINELSSKYVSGLYKLLHQYQKQFLANMTIAYNFWCPQ